ncbi:hypothetical protein ACVWZ4_001404 [Bradyrhizobium sp. USDA 4472]
MTPATLNRRALITGRVLSADRVVGPPGYEIASIIVQARPERLTEVEAEISALPTTSSTSTRCCRAQARVAGDDDDRRRAQ